MADDLIKVDIVADYDDKGAKAARKDLDAIDGATAEATVDADVGPGLTQAEGELDAIDGRTVEATVDADVGSGLSQAEGELDAIDGRTAEATVDADVGSGLADAKGDLDAIDGSTATATVDADQGAGLTSAVGELKEIDGGTYKATVDATEGSGLRSVVDSIKGIAGDLGGAEGSLGAMAGPAGLAAGLAAALLGAATQAADTAAQAQRIAQFTGASVEDASRLQAVLGDTTDIEAADLLDMIANMAGVLADNPALVNRFGLTLDQVRQNPLAAFVQIVDKIGADGKISFDELLVASQLFGEEGVRQVNDIIAAVGPDGLQGAMDDVSDTRVMSDEDVQAARDLKAGMAEVKAELDALILDLGRDFLPLLSDAATAAGTIARNLFPPSDPQGTTIFGGIMDDTEEFTGLSESAREQTDLWSDAITAAADAGRDQAAAIDDVVEAETEAVDVVAEMTKELEAQKEAHDAAAKAAEEQADAMLSANDVFYAQQDAMGDVRDAVADYNDILGDNEATQSDVRRAMRNVSQAADDLAEANVNLARNQAEQEGRTLSATEALDLHNATLLEQAIHLDGPLRGALVGHIARLNAIPEEELTDIIAAINAGKLEEAEAALADVSRARDATIEAETEQTAYDQTDRDLDHLARDRTAKIYADYIFRQQVGAGPGPGAGSVPSSAAPAAAWAGGDTYNLNLPRGTRADDTIRALDRHARRNGRRPYAFR